MPCSLGWLLRGFGTLVLVFSIGCSASDTAAPDAAMSDSGTQSDDAEVADSSTPIDAVAGDANALDAAPPSVDGGLDSGSPDASETPDASTVDASYCGDGSWYDAEEETCNACPSARIDSCADLAALFGIGQINPPTARIRAALAPGSFEIRSVSLSLLVNVQGPSGPGEQNVNGVVVVGYDGRSLTWEPSPLFDPTTATGYGRATLTISEACGNTYTFSFDVDTTTDHTPEVPDDHPFTLVCTAE